jgi:peptidoglycan/xylan/chitin deacetylase (PgdA/CDA1 family)
MTGEILGASLAALGAGALVVGAYHPNCTLFGPVIGRGPRRGRALYLTFDDGPNPTATERIAETLQVHRVPAAFFMVGAHVKRHPELSRAVARAGHEVGNHTQHHLKLHLRGPATISRELEESHAVLSAVTGRPPRTFRAPHGLRNPFVTFAAGRLGYTVFGWTFGVFDSARPGSEEIRRRVRARLRPGAVILLHDGDGYDPAGDRRQTADALPGIIRDARDAGYDFRSLRELIRA